MKTRLDRILAYLTGLAIGRHRGGRWLAGAAIALGCGGVLARAAAVTAPEPTRMDGTELTAAKPSWTPIGPPGGGVSAVAYCAALPKVAYAGTVYAGMFRSDDGGVDWAPAATGLRYKSVTALIVSPDSCAVAYAATFTDQPTFVAAISVTMDGGRSWRDASAAPAAYTYAFGLDPRDRTTLYAATSSGLFRTRLGQTAWTAIWQPGPPVFSVAVDPATSSTLYATLEDEFGDRNGVYKSTDGGRTWNPANGRWLRSLPQQAAFNLLFDPTAPSATLYVISGIQLFKTIDGAQTWTGVEGPGPIVRSLSSAAGALYSIWEGDDYVASLAVSRDHGLSWQALTGSGPADSLATLAVDPGGSQLLVAGALGLWRSADGGESWRAASRGLVAQRVPALAVATDGTLYVGVGSPFSSYGGGGVFRTTDQGARWRRLNKSLGAQLVLDPRHPSTLYSFSGGLENGRSDDGGLSWSDVYLPLGTLVVDPTRSSTLYSTREAVNQNDYGCLVLKSGDRGKRWTCIDPASQQGFAVLIVDPQHPATLYGLGDAQDSVGLSAYLLRSDDGGASWAPADSGLPEDRSALAVDPTRSWKLYVATAQGLFRSGDRGQTWQLLSTSLPPGATRLMVDPRASSRLYAGIPGRGVLGSSDGGISWAPLGSGLPLQEFSGVFDLDPLLPATLYAGTDGAGVFRLDLER
jgi:photosystem II stability/assembly factor-like uncharacterized protein